MPPSSTTPRIPTASASHHSSARRTRSASLPIGRYVKPSRQAAAPTARAALNDTSRTDAPRTARSSSNSNSSIRLAGSTHWCASTGCVVSARRASNASSYTNTTCARCLNATSSCATATALTARSAYTSTSIRCRSCRPARTTIWASVRWDRYARRSM